MNEKVGRASFKICSTIADVNAGHKLPTPVKMVAMLLGFIAVWVVFLCC